MQSKSIKGPFPLFLPFACPSVHPLKIICIDFWGKCFVIIIVVMKMIMIIIIVIMMIIIIII